MKLEKAAQQECFRFGGGIQTRNSQRNRMKGKGIEEEAVYNLQSFAEGWTIIEVASSHHIF